MVGAAVVMGESSSRSCGSSLQHVTSNGRNKVLVGGLCSCVGFTGLLVCTVVELTCLLLW